MARDIQVNREGREMAREGTRMPTNFIRPAVDIFETEEGLTLKADLPGLGKESLDVNIDKGILTLSGRAKAESKGEDVYREFSMADYYRQFQLPDEIDPEKTSAELRNGVLTLFLPKAEAAKPKRIEIMS